MGKLQDIWVRAKGKTITLVLGCFISFFSLFVIINIYSSGISSDINSKWVSTIKVEKANSIVYIVDSVSDYKIKVSDEISKDIAFARIIAYLREVRKRRDIHENTMIFFYEKYFLFNMMQAFMIMVTTTIGLIVSKYGWEKINKNVLYVFFIIAGFVAFTNLVPDFMKIEENIKNNKKYVIIYSNIEQSILSYLSTNENAKGVKIDPVRYVHLLDKEMNGHNNISFDLEKIPEQNFDFSKKN